MTQPQLGGARARLRGRRREQEQLGQLAATQAPVTLSAVTAPSGPPAWKTIPSWDLVGRIDNAIRSSIQLFMANRAHAHITEVKA
jgi:hypothetical protein